MARKIREEGEIGGENVGRREKRKGLFFIIKK